MPRPVWQVPLLRQIRQSGRLNEMLRLGYGEHWGRFATRDQARAFVRARQRVDYDDDAIVKINVKSFTAVHPFDWPVLYFLQQLAADGRLASVTDFGGHVGVKYHAYRGVMDFPDPFVWQVVDVPAICREGRRRLTPSDHLTYHERLEDVQPSDLLLCSGSIQYADLTLCEIVGRLPAPPPVVVVNKVPIAPSDGFFTLQSLGAGKLPYRIFSEGELDDVRERLGYRLRARWDIPHRAFSVPAQRGSYEVKMIGEAWAR